MLKLVLVEFMHILTYSGSSPSLPRKQGQPKLLILLKWTLNYFLSEWWPTLSLIIKSFIFWFLIICFYTAHCSYYYWEARSINNQTPTLYILCPNVLDYPYIISFDPLNNLVKQWFSMGTLCPTRDVWQCLRRILIFQPGVYQFLVSRGQGHW